MDCLDEGLLISQEKGEPVLVNFTMYEVMEKILGTVVRNGNIFWHLLPLCDGRPGLSMERHGPDMLFILESGETWLLQRHPIHFRSESGWQITASDVTDLYRLNQELDEKNRVLKERNAAVKDALGNMVELQTRKTMENLRYKIHDILGQRITILQQLLNNQNISDYSTILPSLEDMMADLREDRMADPKEELDALIAAYGRLGVSVIQKGTLPDDTFRAGEFVHIIREALTNALLHGQAGSITVTFGRDGETALTIVDDGRGLKGPLRRGTGLRAMEQCARNLGADLQYKTAPHFVIILRKH